MRRALVVLAAVLGVLAALAAACLWTVGRDALDEDRFADRALAALRSPEGRASLEDRLVVDLESRQLAPDLVRAARPTIADVIADVVADPAFARQMAPSLAEAHRELIDARGKAAEIDLSPALELVSARVAQIDSRLTQLLPGPQAVRGIRVSTGLRAPLGDAVAELSGRVPWVTILLGAAAAALLALAIAAASARARVARHAGGAMLLLAAIPPLLRLAVPGIAESAIGPPDDALAGDLATALLGGWIEGTLGLAAAGLALALAGIVAPRR